MWHGNKGQIDPVKIPGVRLLPEEIYKMKEI